MSEYSAKIQNFVLNNVMASNSFISNSYFGVCISLYLSFSTRVEAAMLYGMTILLMSYAFSNLFFLASFNMLDDAL